jgi:glycosyltransferase involved in cell wall biosynthesis
VDGALLRGKRNDHKGTKDTKERRKRDRFPLGDLGVFVVSSLFRKFDRKMNDCAPIRISVVVPAYNAAATIVAALDSAASQDGCAHFEIIVVDDASRDRTGEMVNSWKKQHPDANISLIRLDENRGPATARNRAVEEADGEWIAFLDGDDVWFPWHTRSLIEVLRRHPEAVLLCGEALRWSPGENGSIPVVDAPSCLRSRAVTLDELAEHNPVATSTVLLRKSVWRECGGFDAAFRGPEDYDLWLRVAALGAVVFVEAPLAAYRVVPGSLSLDDERFLKEGLGVIAKAYGPGGVLFGRGRKRQAQGYHYLACAWMAAERGDVTRAIRLFAGSCLRWPFGYRGRWRCLPWAHVRLLARIAGARRKRAAAS